MKILLIGYGKMGKTIENIALQRGHRIIAKINSQNLGDLNEALLHNTDVAIEFTTPHTALANIEKCLNNETPVVIGSTGWYDHMDKIIDLCKEKNGSMLAASNFSIGVNLFFAVNEYLARLMNMHSSYKVSIEEIHHVHKLDKPSGTGITTAEGILKHQTHLDGYSVDEELSAKIPIYSIRENEVPGTHTVKYDSDIDSLELKHTAHSRLGFALGAVLAAEFINGKKGVYTMKDLLKI
jgi:4-hydroxy-tetrahydrodipicolinate reductase